MPVERISSRGFSIAELVVSIGVFSIIAVGIYSSIISVFEVIRNSQTRIIEMGLVNEQFEFIRNLNYHDVGVVNGSPSGVLARTVTTTRNGYLYEITRTVRNIDDPFDGTVNALPAHNQAVICHTSGTSSITMIIPSSTWSIHSAHGDTLGQCSGQPPTQDILAADYKLVQVEILCTECGQTIPLIINGRVAPKFIEGDPNNGALFIQVFDANAQPVQGADVHVYATSTSSTYDFVDVTGNDGYLRLVDMNTGTQAFHLTVTKPGYTTDRTRTSSVVLVNPVKPPSTVAAQTVTDISFSIDLVSGLELETVDRSCNVIPSTGIQLSGTKLIGSSPNFLKYDTSLTTDASGTIRIEGLDWDQYSVIPTGYDIFGTIPDFPLTLPAGATRTAQILLTPDTGDNMLVNVRDAISGGPVASAVVTVTNSVGFWDNAVTGVGTFHQSDWSGGSGQTNYSDETRYLSDDGDIDASMSPGNVTLRDTGSGYVTSGYLDSSVIDFGGLVQYLSIEWLPSSQSPETGSSSLRFQLASSPTITTSTWNYYGPDGTTSTYYTTPSVDIHSVHDGDRYMKYRMYLSTVSTTYSSVLSDILLTYTNVCTPPGQGFFGPLSSGNYTVSVSATGYDPFAGIVSVSTDTIYSVELVPTP